MNGGRQRRRPTSRSCHLHPMQRCILDICRWVGFGFIEGQVVEDGLPIFEPMPRIVRQVKLGSTSGETRQPTETDFELKVEMVALLKELENLGSGVIQRIDVRHGVPFRVVMEERGLGHALWKRDVDQAELQTARR